ncbi:hypothetical protein B0H10DRAFT_2223204 [Mycena sp. CBHHK59/15]|nr:hypothetical protein B0H10DRAFT_2223204 [Mycena sp. CBHHK59/15]
MPSSTCIHPASQKTREAAMKAMSSALQGPCAPHHCGRYLLGCLHLVETEEVIPKRFLRNHDFWNTSMRFLTTPRSKKQTDVLLERLSICPAKGATTYPVDFHEIGRQYESCFHTRYGFSNFCGDWDATLSDGKAFLLCLMLLLSKCMTLTKKHMVARGREEMWPTSIDDLIPFGAEATVVAMDRWRRAYPHGTLVLRFCGELMRLCQLLIIPRFTASSLCEDLIGVGRKLFDHTMTGLSSTDRGQRRHVTVGFYFQVQDIESLLKDIWDIPFGEFEIKMVNGHETKLVQMCSLLLHACTDPRLQVFGIPLPNMRGCIRTAAHFYRLYHMHLQFRAPFPVHPQIIALDTRIFPPSASYRNLRNATVLLMHGVRASTLCIRIGCLNSLQSAGTQFKRCSRCNLTSYCSAQCQEISWKTEAYPHKRVCPKLRHLLSAGGGVENLRDVSLFLKNWLAEGVAEEDVQYVHDWYQITDRRQFEYPNGLYWSPVFKDYDKLVAQFGADDHGPKAAFFDNLARWPCEAAKQKELAQQLPFFEQDLD